MRAIDRVVSESRQAARQHLEILCIAAARFNLIRPASIHIDNSYRDSKVLVKHQKHSQKGPKWPFMDACIRAIILWISRRFLG